MTVEPALADLRLALRLLARAPAFSLASVLVMALGIGANSAIFTALDQTVIRPLPYDDPSRLAMLWEDFSAFGVAKQRVSPGTFVDWRRLNHTFEALAAYGGAAETLTGGGAPQEALGVRVTANLIPLLGVRPLVGRTFAEDEEGLRSGAPVILGYRLWQGRYGGAPGVVGRVIQMNGESHQVIGVMPARFAFPDRDTDFWLPLGLSPEMLAHRNSHFLKVVGRLARGRDPAEAQADMTAVASQLARAFPATNARIGITVVPLKDEMVGDTRTAFTILIAAAACVLLIACANVAHLALARSATRQADFAVRLAVGASPLRILSAMLTESLLLSGGGAAVGLVAAHWTLAALQRMVPSAMAGFVALHLDGRTLAFTAAITIASATLFGLIPGFQASRAVWHDPRTTIGRVRRRSQQALIVGEVAIAFVLVVGAGLLIQTLWRLRAVNPGFRSDGILTAHVSVPLPKYENSDRRSRFYVDALHRIAAIPGVTLAGATSDLPYTSRGNTMSIVIDGQPAASGVGQDVLFRLVSAEYLQTIGARLVEGRFLDAGDRADSTPVVVINQAMARQYWSGEPALGHRIDTGTGDGAPRWMTVVGVVADLRERGLDLRSKAAVYVPFAQTAISFFQPSELAVRTAVEPLSIAREVQEAVWSVDPEQPVSNLRTMDAIVDGELANRTQVLELLGTFAGLALVLAAFGVYAVLSFLVSQRTREIGLRLALGARRQDIMRGMLGDVGLLTGVGLLAGTAAGIAATRLLSSLLYGVTPLDVSTFASMGLLLAAVTLLASYLPTRRAAMTDPVVALRAD